MTTENKEPNKFRVTGYAELVERYKLKIIPNWHQSMIADSSAHRVNEVMGVEEEIFPKKYWPGDSIGDHLEFALKYDGINLAILSLLFQEISEVELLDFIKSKPTGKYARKVWFLFEYLTGKTLPLDDLHQGNYIDLLEPEKYYTSTIVRRIRRQRVNDNQLGERRFCPTVRRTEIIREFEIANLTQRCERVVSGYSPAMLRRALRYLYTKETKSSFEIEKIKPCPNRIERFISLLNLAEKEDFCLKPQLIKVQNLIVDERFQDSDYRSSQNYVGETVFWQNEKIHFVGPKPEVVSDLMGGLIATHDRMKEEELSPVIQAAIIAYGFVFIHPFEDGNGRIHRFLIHNILARRGFTPKGLMFPISAAMLNEPGDYDSSLEAFSKPLMPLVDYSIDESGQMAVQNNTSTWYRCIDLTNQVETLFGFIEKTIENELKKELEFLANYDQTKNEIQAIVDLPDKLIDLFIRFCLQNKGKLSRKKRESYFSFLLEDEIEHLEQAVKSGYGDNP